jgi:hypothetical protein
MIKNLKDVKDIAKMVLSLTIFYSILPVVIVVSVVANKVKNEKR